MFWHAFCCASHFITFCFYLCSDHAFAFTCAFPSYLLVRRSVRSTSAAPVGCCVLDPKQDTAKYSPERPIRKNRNTWQIWNPPYNPSQGVRTYRRATPKKIRGPSLFAFFRDLLLSKTRSKFYMKKTSKKLPKSMVLGSQNPPKIHPKSIQNRTSKKHSIFHQFFFDFFCFFYLQFL